MLERVPLQEPEEINIEQIDDLNVDLNVEQIDDLNVGLNVDLANDGDSEEFAEIDVDRLSDLEELLMKMDGDERFDNDFMNNDDGFDSILQIAEYLANGHQFTLAN